MGPSVSGAPFARGSNRQCPLARSGPAPPHRISRNSRSLISLLLSHGLSARVTFVDGCVWERSGLRCPPPRRHLRVSDIGIDSASTSSFHPAHLRLDHLFKRSATTTSAIDRHRAAIVTALGRWSSYLYMATNVAVPAIGPATSPSSSFSMPHRHRRRIFLDYTSLFSGNCVLLRQLSLYVVLAPRSSRRPSLLVSSDIGVWQAWRDVSSSTVRHHRLFSIIFLNDCHDRVTVFVFSASSRTLVHDALPCVHDYFLAPLAPCGSATSTSASRFRLHRPRLLYARLHRPWLARTLRFGYIDMAQRAIICIDHSCWYSSPVQVSALLTLGLRGDVRVYGS
uniref:Uncharacterized protein n=1 Tax=Oryza punctata TaxID=4537 RepID=A0A0E0LAX5_ORYPU